MPALWAGLINTQLENHHDLVNGAGETERGGEIDFIYVEL